VLNAPGVGYRIVNDHASKVAWGRLPSSREKYAGGLSPRAIRGGPKGSEAIGFNGGGDGAPPMILRPNACSIGAFPSAGINQHQQIEPFGSG